jgi:hypothetical protein
MDELPAEPHECRRNAERFALDEEYPAATAWALLAIAGELAERRRLERKRRS